MCVCVCILWKELIELIVWRRVSSCRDVWLWIIINKGLLKQLTSRPIQTSESWEVRENETRSKDRRAVLPSSDLLCSPFTPWPQFTRQTANNWLITDSIILSSEVESRSPPVRRVYKPQTDWFVPRIDATSRTVSVLMNVSLWVTVNISLKCVCLQMSGVSVCVPLLCLLYVCSACYISNCPVGGKRSLTDAPPRKVRELDQRRTTGNKRSASHSA